MKKNISILSIAMGILIVFSILAFALETIEVKDYIKDEKGEDIEDKIDDHLLR